MIALALIGWFYWAARRVDHTGTYHSAAMGLTLSMLVWISLCSWLALEDFFYQQNARFLAVVVASIAVVALILGAFLRVPALRGLVSLLMRDLSRGQVIAVQALRITALGAILKMLSGELPATFVLPSALTDMLFGFSAVYVSWNADRWSRRFLIAWNSAGIFIFLGALVTMQLSLPGPLRIFTEEPTTRIVVSFPMVLVPIFIAPMFILIHLLSIKQVFEQDVLSGAGDPA